VGFEVLPEGVQQVEFFGWGEAADVAGKSRHRVDGRKRRGGCESIGERTKAVLGGAASGQVTDAIQLAWSSWGREI
jgi:hypothetical protein